MSNKDILKYMLGEAEASDLETILSVLMLAILLTP